MKKRILSILLALCMLFCLVPTTAFAADCAEDLVDPVIWIHLSSDGGGYYDVLNGTWTAADFFQPGKAPKGAKITAVMPPTSPSIPVSVNVNSDGTLNCTKTENTTEPVPKSETYTVTITSDDYAPISAPLTVRQYLNAGFRGPVYFDDELLYGDTYTYTCRVNNPGENGVWSALIQDPQMFEIYKETTDTTSEPGKSIYTVHIRAIKAGARVTCIDFLYVSDTTMASSKVSRGAVTGGAVRTRPLTVTAGSATITEGNALPTDLVTCTGLLNSEGRKDDRDTVLDNALGYQLLDANNEEVTAATARNMPGTYTVVPAATLKSGWGERYSLNKVNGTLTVENQPDEQFTLAPGGRYYFDLSTMNIPGTVNSNLPDSTLHYVPFTYVGTVNAYKLTSETATTQAYAQQNKYLHSLFIADHAVTNDVSWDALNTADLIFGKDYAAGGVDYTLRAPSVGSGFTGSDDSERGTPQSNEWDAVLDKNSGYVKNWNDIYSWGQDTSSYESWYRAVRGCNSARLWSHNYVTRSTPYVGFRPVLEVPNSDTLDSGGLKAVTLDLGGGTLGGSSDAIHIIVKTGSKFTAPASDGMTRPDGDTGNFFMWRGSNGKFYVPGDSVPADVTALTVQWTVPTYAVTLHPNGGTINSGNVTGWRYCAGIVGNISSGSQPSTITGCVNTGSITAPSTCAAGIVSNLPNGCKVTACYNTGAIKAGGNYPAGIVGYCANSEVRSCFNLGMVTCNTTFTYGSVIGTVSSADAVIKNLYYLEGTCEKGGIGAVKNAETQTAAVRTAEEIANAEFVSTMNADLAEAAFTSGCTATKHPILLWQADAEHTFANTASDVIKSEATCTEAAVYYVKCDNCDAVSNTLTVKVGEPLGHDLTVTVVEPTCEKDGYTNHVCSVCGDSYRDNYVDAAGHQYTLTVTAPTCTAAGYTTHLCSVCGHSYVDSIVPATGHSYEDTVTAPTCTAAGYTTHTCSVCGDSYVDSIVPATGHSYEAVVTAPTCDKMGYTTYTCSVCDDSYVGSYTDALEHTYTAVVTKEPTCTEEGVKTFTCSECGKSYTEAIPTVAHSYEAVVTAPTCDKMGYTTYTCSVCGDSYVADYVDAAGHDCETETVPATCLGYGFVRESCKHCDYSVITEITAPLGHDYQAVVTEPTLDEAGYTTHTCSRCGDSYVDSETPALGHKCAAYTDIPTDWAKEGICFVIENGLMVGTTSTTFAPKDTLTRAMLVTVLYRMAGSPAVDAPSGFTDVADGQWYSDAIAWAAANGIVNGVGGNKFAPSEPVTREQLAAIFFRYAKAEAPEVDVLSGYPDAEAISTYARDAMAWAVSTGLVTGSKEADGTYLAPQGLAAREQAAAILMRYVKANA